MYVCIHTYMCIYAYIYIYMHIYTYTHTYAVCSPVAAAEAEGALGLAQAGSAHGLSLYHTILDYTTLYCSYYTTL